MLRRITLALMLSCMSAPAATADPIFTPLAIAAFNAGLGVTATNAIIGIGALGSVFSAVGSLALSVGISYLASLGKKGAPQQRPSDGQVEVRQTVPPRVFHYGRVKASGPLAYYESSGGSLIKVILISGRQIDGFENIYVNDVPVTFDGGGAILSPPIDRFGFIRMHLGTDTQLADDMLLSGYEGVPGAPYWNSDRRLRGSAYLACAFKTADAKEFNARYPNGEPSIGALFRGALFYDPRRDSTVAGGSGLHRAGQPSTWEWSENAGLAIVDFLTHPDGYARPISKLQLSSFMTFADLCDELVATVAGSERRYRIATSFALTDARKDILARLLAACDASLYPTSDGKIAIRGGKWEEPTVTIDADEGHIIESNFAPPDAMSRFNELSIHYLDPALEYVENDGEPWLDVDDYAATGELKTAPLDLVQVPSHSQARRLAKIKMARDNCDWIGEIVTNFWGLNAIGERVVRLKWPELDIDGPYWVEGGPTLLPDMTGVRLKLRSANAASYDWTTAEEGTSTSVPPDTSPALTLDPPEILLSEGDGPTIVATWTASQALNRSYEVRYRQDGSSDYQPMTVADTRDQAVSGAVLSGEAYFVQIRVSAGVAAVGPWSGETDIDIA